jgi:hypothetical protein
MNNVQLISIVHRGFIATVTPDFNSKFAIDVVNTTTIIDDAEIFMSQQMKGL